LKSATWQFMLIKTKNQVGLLWEICLVIHSWVPVEILYGSKKYGTLSFRKDLRFFRTAKKLSSHQTFPSVILSYCKYIWSYLCTWEDDFSLAAGPDNFTKGRLGFIHIGSPRSAMWWTGSGCFCQDRCSGLPLIRRGSKTPFTSCTSLKLRRRTSEHPRSDLKRQVARFTRHTLDNFRFGFFSVFQKQSWIYWCIA